MIILLSSIAVHAVTALIITIVAQPVSMLGLDPDIYGVALAAAKKKALPSSTVLHLAGGSLVQGVIAALIVRLYLWLAVRRNALPEWLFGWTAEFANFADDHDKTLVALVLTDMDFDGGSLCYAGTVRDLGVTEHGDIRRIVLDDCQRYVIPLNAPTTGATLRVLSIFDHFVIDQSHIRNVTFEVLEGPNP